MSSTAAASKPSQRSHVAARAESWPLLVFFFLSPMSFPLRGAYYCAFLAYSFLGCLPSTRLINGHQLSAHDVPGDMAFQSEASLLKKA